MLAVNHQDQKVLGLCAKFQSSAVGDSPASLSLAALLVVPLVGASADTEDH